MASSTPERRVLAIVGAGVVGKAMAMVLSSRGYRIAGVASRTLVSARACAELAGCDRYATDPVEIARLAPVVLISTPDRRIRSVCERIAAGGGFVPGGVAIHLSGALGSDELDAARRCGAFALSLHPIQTFADHRIAAGRLVGSYFSLEGDQEAISLGHQLVADLSGRPVVISPRGKSVYHAALCVASNYLVVLADLAVRMLHQSDVPEEDALPMLMPLIRGTVKNLEQLGLPRALTGPIGRGDASTVEAHLTALRHQMPEVLNGYALLGEWAAEVGERKGTLDPERRDRIVEMLRAAVHPDPDAKR